MVVPMDVRDRLTAALSATGQFAPLITQAALADFINEGHLINHGIGIRHHNDGGHPTRCRSMTGGLQRFAMFSTGFADEHLGVDQTRTQHVALTVDDSGAFGSIAAQVRADVGDHAVLDQHPADLVAARRWIDQASVEERQWLVGLWGWLGWAHWAAHFINFRAPMMIPAMVTCVPIIQRNISSLAASNLVF